VVILFSKHTTNLVTEVVTAMYSCAVKVAKVTILVAELEGYK
jgi:hypothetical protein